LAHPVAPWKEAHTGVDFLAVSATCGRPAPDQSVPEELKTLERTHSGEVCEEIQPVGSIHIEGAHEGLCAVGETSHWSRGRTQGGRSSRGYV